MKTNWPTKKLGEVIDFLKGKKMPVTEEQRLGYEPYIGIDTLRTREYKLFTPEKDGVKCSKDDVLVVWDGAYAGTVGIEVSGFAGSTVAKVVIREPELDSRFLRYFWEFNGTKIRNAAQGAAIPHLSKPFINNLKIPLPPLQTQTQIVERLDKIAEAQKLNDELIQKTDELFHSLLHQELNPAGKDWESKKLGEVFERVTESILPTKQPDQEFNFIGLENIESNTGQIVGLNPTKGKLIKSTKTVFRKNDVLYGKLRPYLNKVWVFGTNGICSKDIWVLRAKQDVISPLLLSSILRQQRIVMKSSASMAGANLPRANKNVFDSIKIQIPPLATQKQIVAKLSAVQEYKNRILDQKAKLRELFESALYNAFRGSPL